MRKYGLIFVLSMVLVFAFGPSVLSQSFLSLSPLSFDLEISPGSRVPMSVRLSNRSDREVVYQLRSVPVYQSLRTGQYLSIPEGDNPEVAFDSRFSCADWIRLRENRFVIGPQQSVIVAADLVVPRNALPGGYTALLLFEDVTVQEEISVRESGAVMSLTVSGGPVVFVEVRRRGTVSTRSGKFGVIEKLETIESPSGVTILATLANQGNRFIEVYGRGRLVLSRDGQRVGEVPLGGGRGRVIPGQKVAFPFTISPPFTPGSYLAEVLIDYGGVHPAREEITFQLERTGLLEAAQVEIASSAREEPVRLYANHDSLKTGIAPRASRALSVTLYNDSTEPVAVSSTVRDLAEVESTRFSQQVDIVPASFQIPPHGRQNVQIRVRCPDPLPDGNKYVEALFVPRILGNERLPVEMQQAFSVPVFLILENRHGEAVPQAQIGHIEVGLELREEGGEYPQFTARFQNTGNIHLQPQLELVLTEIPPETGEEEGVGVTMIREESGFSFRSRVSEDLVLPGQEGVLSATSPRPRNPEISNFRVEMILWEGNRDIFREVQEFNFGG